MLAIRQVQVDLLASALRARNCQEIEEKLRQRFEGRLADRPSIELQQLIEDGFALAQRNGVLEPDDLFRLLVLLIEWGADLESAERTQWAGNILRRKARTGSQKIDALEAHGKSVRLETN